MLYITIYAAVKIDDMKMKGFVFLKIKG